nr:glycosyltransferase [Arthrobacter zhangbolii]
MRATWAHCRRIVASTSTEASRLQRVRRSPEVPVAVGLAVDTQLAGLDPVRPPGIPPELPFLLSVGRLNVRKNLGYAINVSAAAGAIGPGRPLLIVGEPNGAATVGEYPPHLLDSGTVRFLGRVTDAELAWLYSNATAFIFTSRDEGFGLPPLEAAHFGCPILVSDIPVMREVTAELPAVYLPLDDTDTAAKLIAHALDTGFPAQHGEAAGPIYSWPATATALRLAMA